MSFRLALALLLPVSHLSLQATEVYLKNGDKLSGICGQHKDGMLLLTHPLLGELKIPDSEILKLEETTSAGAQLPNGNTPKPVITTATPQAPAPAAAPAAAPATAPATAATAPAPAAAATPAEQAPSTPKTEDSSAPSTSKAPASIAKATEEADDDEPPQHTWLSGWKRVLVDSKGTLEFGYQNQDGRKNTSNLNFRANAEYKAQQDNYRIEWRYYYSEYNDAAQTDKMDGTFRWRHDLSKRTFTQTVTSHSRDRIKNINIKVEQSLGMGYAALNTKRQKFNVGSGLVGQYRDVTGTDNTLIAQAQLFEDYTRKINSRFSIKQDALIQYTPITTTAYTTLNGQVIRSDSDRANYRYTFNTALQGTLTKTISLNLRFEYEFDNSIGDKELRSDRRISTTLGYTF